MFGDSPWKARAFAVLLVAIVGVVSLITFPRLRVTTAITHFLPDAADRRAGLLAKRVAEGELASTLVIDLSGGDPRSLGETASKLMAALREDPATRSVRSGIDDGQQEQLFRLFVDRSPTVFLGADALDDGSISRRLDRLKMRLASPMGAFVRHLAPTDPLGGLLDALDEMAELNGGSGLSSRQGVLFSKDDDHAFLFATTHAGSFDATAQRAYLDRLKASFARVRVSPEQRIETSGIARFAVASEKQIRGDIERIGSLSTIGILALFLLLFRSPRMLVLGLVPLGVGSAVAVVATHVVFGEIHGLTLAFGTSLLGVGIDYAEHYFSHFALEPERGAQPIMRSVWPGLWMGGLTTIVGFAGLGLTGFPGVRQIAFFSIVAILAALLATRWLVPPWMPASYVSVPAMARAGAWAERTIQRVMRQRRLFIVVPAVVMALCVSAGLARTRFIDDVSTLLSLDNDLVAEDARVRGRLSPLDPGRFVVVVHESEEEALTMLDETTTELEAARRDGLLAGWTPLGTVLRSRAAQRASFERAKARRDRVRAVMHDEGFVPDAFAPFFQRLDEPEPTFLTLADVRPSALGTLVGPLSPRFPEGQAFIVPLRGVVDVEALRARLPRAVLIDDTSLLEGTYRNVRRQTTIMLLVGILLVTGVLVLRYRSRRLVFTALLPGALGAAAALGFFGALGTPLNLLHFVGVLLVLSMGVDYGIFVVEGRATSKEGAHALVSIMTATSTTLLSFGLLALSPSPALRTLGTTITVGLLVSAVSCPIFLVLFATPGPTREPS